MSNLRDLLMLSGRRFTCRLMGNSHINESVESVVERALRQLAVEVAPPDVDGHADSSPPG